MKINVLKVEGLSPAIKAMRNPFDSWDRSDTKEAIGPLDKRLSMKLTNAGDSHSKHLRMIQVWAEIEAPRYWWMEFATYRNGVEMLSCSTMHTLTKRPLTLADFEHDGEPAYLMRVIDLINKLIAMKNDAETVEDDKAIWRQIIQLLPQSFLQKRTVMMSYQALRNMYRQREGHKLKEWAMFRGVCEELPESWMITDKE